MNISKPPYNNLKSNYLIYFETALVCTLLVMIGAFKINFSGSDKNTTFKENKNDLFHLESALITSHKKPTPPPPPKVDVPFILPEDEIIQEFITDLDMEFKSDDPIPMPESEPATKPAKDNSNTLYYADEMPELIGGFSRLQKKIKYPRKAIRDKVEGRVVIQFIVDERGRVLDPEVVKSLRDDCDSEVVKAISGSRFSPALQQGVPVRTVLTMYIRFELRYS